MSKLEAKLEEKQRKRSKGSKKSKGRSEVAR